MENDLYIKPWSNIAIENSTQIDTPMEIYRYFDKEEHRENFLNGQIWFCGPSQNRFFHKPQDKTEYRNNSGVFLFEYSLSCSEELIENQKYYVKIVNPHGFVQEIIETIHNKKTPHRVSWFSKKELEVYEKEFPILRTIEDNLISADKIFAMEVVGLGCAKAKYVDKQQKLDINEPFAISENARAKSNEYLHEKEVRVHINTSNFFDFYTGEAVGHSLMNRVRYLKIICPNIKKYCLKL